MNDKQILEAVMRRAIEGGYHVFGNTWSYFKNNYKIRKDMSLFRLGWIISPVEDPNTEYDIEVVIFSHDFAKALWREDYANFYADRGDDITWQGRNYIGHLMELVACKEPIKYLGHRVLSLDYRPEVFEKRK